MDSIVFATSGAILLAMALCVVLAQSPLRAALALIVALCAQSSLYVLLEAPFVAAMQVLVYAGAIMVLFLFVIMLLNLGPDALRRPIYLAVAKLTGAAAVGYVGLRVAVPTAAPSVPALGPPPVGTVLHMGELLLGEQIFAFEAISVLLLVAVLGAVVLGLRRLA